MLLHPVSGLPARCMVKGCTGAGASVFEVLVRKGSDGPFVSVLAVICPVCANANVPVIGHFFPACSENRSEWADKARATLEA